MSKADLEPAFMFMRPRGSIFLSAFYYSEKTYVRKEEISAVKPLSFPQPGQSLAEELFTPR